MNSIDIIVFLLLFQLSYPGKQSANSSQLSPISETEPEQKPAKTGVTKIVFKSTDGGHTWKDISDGLPEPVRDNYGIGRNVSFTDKRGLYLTAGNALYHTNADAKTPGWEREVFPDQHSSITPGKNGIFAYNYSKGISHKPYGSGEWSAIFSSFQEKQIRSVFETSKGTVFIGTDRGLFKSSNSGKTWKHVYDGGLVGKFIVSNDVVVATSNRGIIRSTDDGENWAVVISEGGVGIDVERINGGFAAITFNTQSNTRRVRTSYDGGETWQPIDAGLQPRHLVVPAYIPFPIVHLNDSTWHPVNNRLPDQAFITSIIQVGQDFFCGHPAGIFRSSDNGKTWKLVLPSIKGKVFNVSVSGNVIYAISRDQGC